MEIRRLEQLQLDADTLLHALGADPGSFVTSFILQGLQRGDSRQSIALQVNEMRAEEARNLTDGLPSCSEIDIMDSEPTTNSSYSVHGSAGSSINNDQMCPLEFCDCCQSDSPASPLAKSLDPTAVVSANAIKPPDMDPWTKSGWPKAHVRALIDHVLGWDGMLFCLVWRDLFLKDFEHGGTQYCSSALVNALLALATRSREQAPVINQSLDSSQQRLNTSSDGFFAEATDILPKREGRPNNLADIQALGLLALYEASSNREDQAQELADGFAAAITDLCLHEASLMPEDSSYELARATTYCGALTLLRYARTFAIRSFRHSLTD